MRYIYFTCLITVFIFPINTVLAQDKNIIPISNFSSGNLNDWKTKVFSGVTRYQIIKLDNIFVLSAESHSSASGLYKEQRIDLYKTPFLNWRWRIANRLPRLNEQSKSGDDFSARIYIVVKGGWAFWRTKAINYVWAENTRKGVIWPNAFVGKKAMMVAQRSAKDKIQTWYQEKRNIRQDFKDIFAADIQYIDAIALMTDTDNSRTDARAYYADIYFSAE
ncbi:MAG: DUF3047 domain-containing protein [Methylococcales bacterium]